MKPLFELPSLYRLSGQPVTGGSEFSDENSCNPGGTNSCTEGGGERNVCDNGGGSDNCCGNGGGIDD